MCNLFACEYNIHRVISDIIYKCDTYEAALDAAFGTQETHPQDHKNIYFFYRNYKHKTLENLASEGGGACVEHGQKLPPQGAFGRTPMTKRTISLLLTIAMVAALTIATLPEARSAPDYTFRSFGSNLQWRLSTDGYLEITLVDLSDPSEWPSNWGTGSANAPWYQYRDSIKIVAIGEGINRIGNYAFNGCTSLVLVNQVNSPGKSGISHIGNYAFNGCVSLTEVDIWADTSVTDIGDYAFNGCVSLSLVNTVDVVNIGNHAFNGCINLASLDLGSAANIGDYAFNGCVNLNRIELPGRMESMGDGVFAGCRSLETIDVSDFGDGNLYLDVLRQSPDDLAVLFYIFYNLYTSQWEARMVKAEILNNGGTPRSHYIPERLEIDFSRYPPAHAAEKITFPLTRIDVEAFAYQSSLAKVTIPATVAYVGLNAFSWNNNLKEAHFFGHAPTVPQVPSIAVDARIFENAASDFKIYFDYFPDLSSTGWPIPPLTHWRGYTALANNVYVLIAPSTPQNPYTPIVTTIEKGNTIQLRATVYPTNADQTVTWASSDPSIATVSSAGVIHAISPGEAIITVSTVDGSRSASRRVHVLDRTIPLTAIALDKSRMTLVMDSESSSEAGNPIEILTAIIYPNNASPTPTLIWRSSNTSIAYVDISNPLEPHNASIVAVAPGTVTITVTARTETKEITSVATTVIVTANPYDPSTFVPVTGISLNPSVPTVSMGATINLTEISTVMPAKATNNKITGWKIISELSTVSGAVITSSGDLTVPGNETGIIVVEATVQNGRSDAKWGYGADMADADYTQYFTINVVTFEPVIGINDVPQTAHTGVPLQLSGTVVPQERPIEWSISEDDSGETAAYIDPVSGMLVAQKPGFLKMVATVKNARWVDGLTGGTLEEYRTVFTIRVLAYEPNTLTVRANPGGRVSLDDSQSPSGTVTRNKASEEISEIRAHPDAGYIFSGWHSGNGGAFADPNSSTTRFTMPNNETTVTAFFTYTGITDGWSSGAVVIPTPGHYFTYGNRYQLNSAAEFSHISRRDFQLFSHVTLDNRTLTKNGHYTAERSGAYTMITFVNGYLDSLEAGSYTLNIHFTDRVIISATFTVSAASNTAPTTPAVGVQIYDDVRSSDWFYLEVSYVSERTWMTANATDPRLFRPHASATQGETVEALYRMSGRPGVIADDGTSLRGREAALEWARQNSIVPVGGTILDDSFATRQDIAHMLSRLVGANYMSYPVTRAAPNFADEWSIDPAVRSAVTNLYRAGILDGRANNTFVPQGYMTRAELAVVLYRFSTIMK